MAMLDTYMHKGKGLHVSALEGAVTGNGASEGLHAGDDNPSGVGSLSIDDLRVEPDGEALIVTARVTGPDLAYLYAEVLVKDSAQDRYYGPVTREYIRAERNEGSSGITRPDWDDPVDVRVRTRPLLRLVTDGANQAFCFAFPEGYSSPGYRQGGLYTVAGETKPLRALLGFSADGALRRAIGYPEGDRRAGKVLTPGQGDRFAPFVQLFNPDATGGFSITSAVADTLTLGSWPLRVLTDSLFAGDYLVGITAQAQDGGLRRGYVPMHLSK